MKCRWLSSLIVAGAAAAMAPAAQAQQSSLGITENESASNLARETGRRATFICPALSAPSAEIWGTDIYADDSSICTAAIHAGVLPMGQAGVVTIVMGGPTGSFSGSPRNGVKSQDYANHDFSYTFSRSGDAGTLDWSTTALGIPEGFTSPVTVICPQGGKSDVSVWGTTTYIADSSICNAAQHVGAISPQGGVVIVTKVPGIETYVANSYNGIDSRAWSAWAAAFQVAAGQAMSGAPADRAGRWIRLDGFTGVGRGDDIQPRTIQLTGFTGTGNGADIRPRIIKTAGWTGTGNAP